MHANIEQLIALRDDEPVDAGIQAHVNTCRECRSKIMELAGMRAHLLRLPVFEVPENAWRNITARKQAEGKHRWRRNLVAATAMAAAVAVVTTAVSLLRPVPRPATPMAQTGQPHPLTVPELISQSRNLENTVLSLNASADHLVINAGTAATVAALEDRIELVDYQINSAATRRQSNPELAQLWQQRVDLLQSLAAVRYAQLASNGL